MEEDTLTNIEVQITGTDGNAFALMGVVSKSLRCGGRADLVEPFRKEAMSSDYNHLLCVCQRYCICH